MLVTEHENKSFLTFIEMNLREFKYLYLFDSVVNYLPKDNLKEDIYPQLIELSMSKNSNQENVILSLIIAM